MSTPLPVNGLPKAAWWGRRSVKGFPLPAGEGDDLLERSVAQMEAWVVGEGTDDSEEE